MIETSKIRIGEKFHRWNFSSLELPTIFPRFTTASFEDKRSPSENEDNSQQSEQLPTILVNGLWITAERMIENPKIGIWIFLIISAGFSQISVSVL